MGYARRQLVTATLTANALRPLPGRYAAIPSFVAGWLTGELAPHLLAMTVLDTGRELARGRGRTRDLALGALALVGLATLVRRAYGVGDLVEDALREGLGVDYQDQLSSVPTPRDLATPWREVARPFRMQSRRSSGSPTSATPRAAPAPGSTSTGRATARPTVFPCGRPRCWCRCTAAAGSSAARNSRASC